MPRLACAAMVLQGVGRKECTLERLTTECAHDSVWTIDLAFLLRNYAPDFTFYTSYFGSKKDYQHVSFYKADFDQDEQRINKLFAAAKSHHVHIVRM